MKRLVLIILTAGLLAGAAFYAKQPLRTPGAPEATGSAGAVDQATAATSVSSSGAGAALAEPGPTVGTSPDTTSAKPSVRGPAVPGSTALESGEVERTVDLLVSPQNSYNQKQAAWKRLREAGKLDEAIKDLEQRMAANPNAAEYPSELGQAYLKKCATLDDMREKGLLALQSDKLFETALAIDPSNWESRFTKAVAMTYWPASMNKGNEVVQQFETLIQQQEGQPSQPNFAGTYLLLGDFYQKNDRADAARSVWERGASLFPDNQNLREKLMSSPGPQTASSVTPTGAANPH